MSFKNFYEELRAARKTRSYNSKSVEETDRDVRKSKIVGEYRDHIKDFTIEEMREILLNENIVKRFYGLIGQGKEANVYWVKDFSNKHLALKVFRIHTTNHNFRSLHTRSKLSDTAKLGIATGLCLTEFENLQVMKDANVRIANPVERYSFMYTMDFLGSKRGPSPLLAEVMGHHIDDPVELLDDILDQYDLLFNEAMMVHGDFSEHNIVYHNEQPFIIDVLQSNRYHERYATEAKIRKREAVKVLEKDLNAILEFFKKRFRKSYHIDDVYQAMAGEIKDLIPDNLMSENYDLESFVEEQKKVRFG